MCLALEIYHWQLTLNTATCFCNGNCTPTRPHEKSDRIIHGMCWNAQNESPRSDFISFDMSANAFPLSMSMPISVVSFFCFAIVLSYRCRLSHRHCHRHWPSDTITVSITVDNFSPLKSDSNSGVLQPVNASLNL